MKKKVYVLAAAMLVALLGIGTFIFGFPKTGDDINDAVVVLHADYPQYDTAIQLVNSADDVFSGIVKNIKYVMINTSTGEDPDTEALPYTLYTIRVTDSYKGNLNGKDIVVKRLGGKSNNVEYQVEDADVIQGGQEYLFLIEEFEHTYPSLLNVTQSSYNMKEANATSNYSMSDEITLSQILSIFGGKK